MLGNSMYLPGEDVLINDIGAQSSDRTDPGSTLVCVTTNINTACCRSRDGGAVGEWFSPDGSMVPRRYGTSAHGLNRVGYTHQVRLSRVDNANEPLGIYTCVVPPSPSGPDVSAKINIVGPTTGMWLVTLCLHTNTALLVTNT